MTKIFGHTEEDDPDAYNQQALRKYELQKMKYYYAIVHTNSKETAIHLVDEYNGFEFENTNLKLHLSFVPDEMEFTQKLKDEAKDIPSNYSYDFVQQGYSRALGHSNVKLTWDQTDAARSRKLAEGFRNFDANDAEAEAEYYKDFIGGSSATDLDDDLQNEEDIEEYRKKLLSGLEKGGDGKGGDGKKKELDFDKIDWDNVNEEDFDSDDLDKLEDGLNNPKKSKDIVQFTSGFGEDIGKKLLKNREEKNKEKQMTPFEKYNEKKADRKRVKKEASKKKKEQDKKMANMSEAEVKEIEKNRKHLEMLVGDVPDDEDEMGFKGDKNDSRFSKVLVQNKDFALDPTHKHFHKMQGGAFAAGPNGQGKNKKQRRS